MDASIVLGGRAISASFALADALPGPAHPRLVSSALPVA
jgi:hypothetical protein